MRPGQKLRYGDACYYCRCYQLWDARDTAWKLVGLMLVDSISSGFRLAISTGECCWIPLCDPCTLAVRHDSQRQFAAKMSGQATTAGT
ncbi:hypothetical protein ElyMa_000466100 [Elysia marginata]|uniref:Uncharacterized protein n=1 Tax=Elysia marginata TaxID=1093978 RepID=A0AAV4FT40_9GAST|nr:hypothetical protein ElyMa_000466100 [Elysia marginata]